MDKQELTKEELKIIEITATKELFYAIREKLTIFKKAEEQKHNNNRTK